MAIGGTTSSGVILIYHHISDSTPAITSVDPDLFEEHLDYLEDEGFQVITTKRMLAAIKNSKPLPEKAIAIHFDDAYESVYTHAYPQLKSRNWPFSIFVATEAIDKKFNGYMTWQQLTEVAEYGAEIGGHSVSHTHLVRRLDGEWSWQWRSRVSNEIDAGIIRIQEKLGTQVELFAYPYGEFNDDLVKMLEKRNVYGLAQHSGAVGPLTNFYAIPRYPMAAGFARMDRFKLVANSKPLPVADVDAGDRVRTAGEDSGTLELELTEGDYQIQNLACYSSAGKALEIARDGFEVEVALPEFKAGRNKVNCTAPSANEKSVFYWFSQLWLVKSDDGKWYVE